MKQKIIKSVVVCVFLLIIFISAYSVFFHIGFDKISAYFSGFTYDSEFSDSKPLSTYYFDKLNYTEKSAYITVFNNIRKHPEYIKIPELTNEEFNNVFFAVKNDNPDILCFADSCNMISFWASSFLHLTYSQSVENCERMMVEMNEVCDELLSGIDTESDYNKELIIHDRMVKYCDYAESSDSSNAYGFLVEKQAVCSGYSRAAMLLLNKAGIESVVVTGTGLSPSDGEVNHMWNIAVIDGSPYHLDVTWDDPVSDSGDMLSHMYFNLTDDGISVDHRNFETSFRCDNLQYNYFVYNDTSYDAYNKKVVTDISQKICENIRNGQNFFEFIFADDDSYASALDSMVNNSSSSSDMYTIMNAIASDNSTDIDTTHVNFSMDDSRKYICISFDNIQK